MPSKIDFTKLNYHDTPLSMEAAIKDVKPLDLPEDIINGKKKIKRTSAKTNKNHCVKLEISY